MKGGIYILNHIVGLAIVVGALVAGVMAFQQFSSHAPAPSSVASQISWKIDFNPQAQAHNVPDKQAGPATMVPASQAHPTLQPTAIPAGAHANRNMLILVNADRQKALDRHLAPTQPVAWNDCLAAVAGGTAVRFGAASQLQSDMSGDGLACGLGGGVIVLSAAIKDKFSDQDAFRAMEEQQVSLDWMLSGGPRFLGSAWARGADGRIYIVTLLS